MFSFNGRIEEEEEEGNWPAMAKEFCESLYSIVVVSPQQLFEIEIARKGESEFENSNSNLRIRRFTVKKVCYLILSCGMTLDNYC